MTAISTLYIAHQYVQSAISKFDLAGKREMWFKFWCYVIWGALRALFCCCCCCCRRRSRCPDLSADVCVVTGGGRGLGRHIALLLSRCGATLVLWDVNEENVRAVAEEIREAGGKAHSYVVDVSRREDVYRAAAQVREEVGDVAVLVNNAAVGFPGTIVKEGDVSDEQIEKTFNVNALGYIWTVRAFLPWMMENDYGYVVNVASVAALFGAPYMAAYSATKAAIRSFSESLHYELDLSGKRGVSVMCVYPTTTNTTMVPPAAREIIRSRNLPLTEPEDVAQAILHGMGKRERDLFIVSSDKLTPVLKVLFPQRAYDILMTQVSDLTSAFTKKD